MKDLSKSAIVEAYKQALGPNASKGLETKTVGNNGYTLGQEFHATGVLKVVDTTIQGNKAVYVAVETEEGVDLSVKSLMGLSSLTGYHTESPEGTEGFLHQWTEKATDKEYKSKMIAPSVVEDFDFADVFQPKSRNLLEFIAIAEEEELFKGKTIRYLGNVVRPYVATKPSKGGFEHYKEGAQRAISVKLWSVD